MMADELGISMQALSQWMRRQTDGPSERKARVRKDSMPPRTRWLVRKCYVEHYKEWGPGVLSAWAEREGLGKWSPTTLGRVIEDLREKKPPKKEPERYEVTVSGAMWSEDGAGFRENGCKKELVVAQDEHSRYKVNYRLVDGPANGQAVYEYLREAFEKHGAPLVLKHDGGKIFHSEKVRGLLDEYRVTDLTGPSYYPQYNGKKERSVRDIKSYERAMRRYRSGGTLADRLGATIHDLNEVRPRPVLGGRTAKEVYIRDRGSLPDRTTFIQEVDNAEQKILTEAVTRRQRDGARRHAVEQVLLRYGLLEIQGGCVKQLTAEM